MSGQKRWPKPRVGSITWSGSCLVIGQIAFSSLSSQLSPSSAMSCSLVHISYMLSSLEMPLHKDMSHLTTKSRSFYIQGFHWNEHLYKRYFVFQILIWFLIYTAIIYYFVNRNYVVPHSLKKVTSFTGLLSLIEGSSLSIFQTIVILDWITWWGSAISPIRNLAASLSTRHHLKSQLVWRKTSSNIVNVP